METIKQIKKKHNDRMKKIDAKTKNKTNKEKYFYATKYLNEIISPSISDRDKKKFMIPDIELNETESIKAHMLLELFDKLETDLIAPYQNDLKNLTSEEFKRESLSGEKISAFNTLKQYKPYKTRIKERIDSYEVTNPPQIKTSDNPRFVPKDSKQTSKDTKNKKNVLQRIAGLCPGGSTNVVEGGKGSDRVSLSVLEPSAGYKKKVAVQQQGEVEQQGKIRKTSNLRGAKALGDKPSADTSLRELLRRQQLAKKKLNSKNNNNKLNL